MTSNRRDFLKSIAGSALAVGATVAWPGAGALTVLAENPSARLPSDAAPPGSFDFVYFTDTHIQPELEAAKGCEMCFQTIAKLQPEFAINGGDHVFDVLGVNGSRANMLFDLYSKTQSALQMPLHQVVGNHDVFGILTKSGISPNDPAYGKKLYQDRLSKPTYYAFQHKGYDFVVLDSIQPTEDRLWEARIDDAQLHWLGAELKKTGPTAPVIVITHVPLASAFASYAEAPGPPPKYATMSVANASEVVGLFAGHNIVAVLQGHLHINEIVSYKDTQYITNGAVCGNWWHGPRMGVPEGFTVVSLRKGKMTTRYETYGFQSVDPREKF